MLMEVHCESSRSCFRNWEYRAWHLSVLKKILGMIPIAVPKRKERFKELQQLGFVVVSNLKEAATLGNSHCIVATDTANHVADGLAVLDLGFDLLLEKPMRVTPRHQIRAVALLKVDCEGGEYDIFFDSSARESLKKCRFLVVEIHPVTTGYDKYQLYMYLTNLGFKIVVAENPGNGCANFYCRNLNA